MSNGVMVAAAIAVWLVRVVSASAHVPATSKPSIMKTEVALSRLLGSNAFHFAPLDRR